MIERDLERALQDLAEVHVRPEAPADVREDARLVPLATSQRRYWLPRPAWRVQSMLSATKFVVAGAIVALFGGALFVAQPLDRAADNGPGAETEALPPVTGPAGNGLIAFSRDGDIYVGDPVTGESEVIVAGPRYDWAPAFSPDGSLLAFSRCKEGYDKSDAERGGDCSALLMVVRPDGSDVRVIAPEAGEALWAPDGRSLIVYERDEPTGTLTLLDASGDAPPRTLVLPTLDLYWPGPPFAGYSHVATFLRPPLGDRILAWTIGGSPKYLDVMDADGSNVTRLIDETWLSDNGFRGVWAPKWSPDGSLVAFETATDDQDFVIVMDADGDDPRVIGEGRYADWSPDGAWILSHQSCDDADDCGSRLTIIDVATGTERELLATTDWVSSSPWSPDGASILYVAGEPQERMYTVDVETGEVTALPSEWDGGYTGPTWQRVAAD